jgi:hypothetical protein
MTTNAILHCYYESDAPSLSDIGITHVSFDQIPSSEGFLSVDEEPIPVDEEPKRSSRVVTVVLGPLVCHSMTENQKKVHVRNMLASTGLSLMNELLIRVRCGNWDTLWRAGRNDPMGLLPCVLYDTDLNGGEGRFYPV